MARRPSITQAPAPLDLLGVAGSPFRVTFTVTVDPLAAISDWEVLAPETPTVTIAGNAVTVEWSAAQTARMDRTGRSWALRATIGGDGPHALVAGAIWCRPPTAPGASTHTTAELAVAIDQQTNLDITVVVGGATAGSGGVVDEVVAGDGITVDALDPVRPVVAVDDDHFGTAAFVDTTSFDPAGAAAAVADDLDTHEGLTTTAHGGIVADDDPRLTDARTPTAHGNEAHTSTFVDAAGAAAAAPVQSVNGETGEVVLDAEAVGAATEAQGALADTAVQPGDLAAVATSGDYDDLVNRPTLGNAAALDVGTTAGTVAAGDDPRFEDGGGNFGGVIAQTSYNPGTVQTVSTTSTTFADVDATNLTVTFVAPPSGEVLVTLTAVAGLVSAGSTALHWNLREGTADVAGTGMRVIYATGSANLQFGVAARFVVTGLTPGQEYTYKWGHARATGSSLVQTIYGGDSGPATMIVEALP